MNNYIQIPINNYNQQNSNNNLGFIYHNKSPSSITSNTIFGNSHPQIKIPRIKQNSFFNNNNNINNNYTNKNFPIQTDFNNYNNINYNINNFNENQFNYNFNNNNNNPIYTNLATLRYNNETINSMNNIDNINDINNINNSPQYKNNPLSNNNKFNLNSPLQKMHKNNSQSNYNNYINSFNRNPNFSRNNYKKQLDEKMKIFNNKLIEKDGKKLKNIDMNNECQEKNSLSNQMTNSSSKNKNNIKYIDKIFSFSNDKNKENNSKTINKNNYKVKKKTLNNFYNSFSTKDINIKPKNLYNKKVESNNVSKKKIIDISNNNNSININNNEKKKISPIKKISHKLINNNIKLYNENKINEKKKDNIKIIIEDNQNKENNIIRISKEEKFDTLDKGKNIKKEVRSKTSDNKINLNIKEPIDNLKNKDKDNNLLDIVDNNKIEENINIEKKLENYASISNNNTIEQKENKGKEIPEIKSPNINNNIKGIFKNYENKILNEQNKEIEKTPKNNTRRTKGKLENINITFSKDLSNNKLEKKFNIKNNNNIRNNSNNIKINFNNTSTKNKNIITLFNNEEKKDDFIKKEKISHNRSPPKIIYNLKRNSNNTNTKTLSTNESAENIKLNDADNEDDKAIKINNVINKLNNKYKTSTEKKEGSLNNINKEKDNFNISISKVNIINNNKEKNKKIEYSKDKNYFRFYAYKSSPGKDSFGNRKINQDIYLAKISMNDIEGFNLFGVLDGHGENGHKVSRFARDFIVEEIKKKVKKSNIKNLQEVYSFLKKDNFSLIKKIYQKVDKELPKQNFNPNFSGSTCIIVFQIGNNLISANVGDSRAILVCSEKNEDIKLEHPKVIELSIDQKPELPQEKKRIYKMGGIVDQMLDSKGKRNGPFRVWAGKQNYPGLAMSRSIGDLKGKKCGLISEPEIIEYKLDEKSKFMTICSDGVWEFLKNEDVMNIGIEFYINNEIEKYIDNLVKTSQNWWKKEDIIMDDITSVVVYF